MDAASSMVYASRPANTFPLGASSRATFYKPHATSSYQQKCHPACRQHPRRAHAQPGASNASPRSDPDAPEKSCSDARPHLSTRCASYPDLQTYKARLLFHASSPTQIRCGPIARSPSTAADLHQSTSNGPCDDYTQLHLVGFPRSPTPPRRSNQYQSQRARDRQFEPQPSPHALDGSRAGWCAQSRRATSRSHCACESAPPDETSKLESLDLLQDCLCE